MAENANDLVIKSLTSALAAAERGHDQNCADALRFAMAIRLQGLRSDTQTATERVAPEAKGRQVRALQYWRLRRVVEYIDAHLADRLGLLDLAAVAGLSRMHFASQFRAATGMRPHEFLLEWRIRRAEELLRNTPTSIVEIAMIVGFQTQAHFTTVFKRLAGCTPRRWRTINRDQQGLPYSGMRRSDIN
jgi:AraC-like DNA-binding protein